MGWSKMQMVSQAFEEIGLATYVFDLDPEQINAALRRLDSMIASWNAKGIRLGYPIAGSPEDIDSSQQTGVPDAANMAIYQNLAILLAPTVGKTVSPDTKISAKQAYNTLLSLATVPMEKQIPANTPAGAGHKTWRGNRGPFMPDPSSPILTGQDGPLEFD